MASMCLRGWAWEALRRKNYFGTFEWPWNALVAIERQLECIGEDSFHEEWYIRMMFALPHDYFHQRVFNCS